MQENKEQKIDVGPPNTGGGSTAPLSQQPQTQPPHGSNKRRLFIIIGTAITIIALALVLLMSGSNSGIPAPKEEVATAINNLIPLTNSELSDEQSAEILASIDEQLTKTKNADQVFELNSLKMQILSNSGRYEEAVEIGEAMLNSNITDQQRLTVYNLLASIYVYKIKDVERLKYYVEKATEQAEKNGTPLPDYTIRWYERAIEAGGGIEGNER